MSFGNIIAVTILLSFTVYNNPYINAQTLKQKTTTPDGGNEKKQSNESRIASVELYRRLLRQKRFDQMEAVKQMMAIDTYDRQYKLVKLLLEKISGVLHENRVKLTELGYTIGDAFPSDENVKDALSMVVENTVFLGDVLLRLPDITNKLLNSKKEWDISVKWAISFINETGILEERDSTLLNLMAQELELVPKDPNYVNPYKENIQKEKEKQKLEESLKKSAGKEKKKKKKKEKQRGPRLHGGRNEL